METYSKHMNIKLVESLLSMNEGELISIKNMLIEYNRININNKLSLSKIIVFMKKNRIIKFFSCIEDAKKYREFINNNSSILMCIGNLDTFYYFDNLDIDFLEYLINNYGKIDMFNEGVKQLIENKVNTIEYSKNKINTKEMINSKISCFGDKVEHKVISDGKVNNIIIKKDDWEEFNINDASIVIRIHNNSLNPNLVSNAVIQDFNFNLSNKNKYKVRERRINNG